MQEETSKQAPIITKEFDEQLRMGMGETEDYRQLIDKLDEAVNGDFVNKKSLTNEEQQRLAHLLDERVSPTADINRNTSSPPLNKMSPARREALHAAALLARLNPKAENPFENDELRKIYDREQTYTQKIAQDTELDRESGKIEKTEEAKEAEEIEAAKSGENEYSIENQDAFPEQRKHSLILTEKVEKDYIQVDGKFFFENNPDALAFKDNGRTLKTKLDSTKVANDMVEVAHARGWSELKVRGSDSFRREVWLEASMRGMKVNGYKPRDEDRALLEKRIKERSTNEITADRMADRAATSAGTTTKEQVVEDDSRTPAQRRADAIRSKEPLELAQNTPDLVRAAAHIKIAEKVADVLPENKRDQFVDAVREKLAENTEYGIETAAVKVKEVIEIKQDREQSTSR